MQIDLTWSFFTTPLFIFFLGLYMHSREKKREKNEAKLAELLKDKEFLKEQELTTWRQHYTESLEASKETLCAIKNSVAGIKENLHDKVDWSFCGNTMQKHDERLRAGKL